MRVYILLLLYLTYVALYRSTPKRDKADMCVPALPIHRNFIFSDLTNKMVIYALRGCCQVESYVVFLQRSQAPVARYLSQNSLVLPDVDISNTNYW